MAAALATHLYFEDAQARRTARQKERVQDVRPLLGRVSHEVGGGRTTTAQPAKPIVPSSSGAGREDRDGRRCQQQEQVASHRHGRVWGAAGTNAKPASWQLALRDRPCSVTMAICRATYSRSQEGRRVRVSAATAPGFGTACIARTTIHAR